MKLFFPLFCNSTLNILRIHSLCLAKTKIVLTFAIKIIFSCRCIKISLISDFHCKKYLHLADAFYISNILSHTVQFAYISNFLFSLWSFWLAFHSPLVFHMVLNKYQFWTPCIVLALVIKKVCLNHNFLFAHFLPKYITINHRLYLSFVWHSVM